MVIHSGAKELPPVNSQNWVSMAEVKLTIHFKIMRLRVRDQSQFTPEEKALVEFKIPMVTHVAESNSKVFLEELESLRVIDKKLAALLEKSNAWVF